MSADPVKAWREEHAYFQRLLALLERQLHVYHGGGEPNHRLMLDIVTYLRGYSDSVHHPREDVAFALLAKRDPSLASAVARLQQEHRVIARAGEILLNQVNAVLEDEVVSRADVEVAIATYVVYYGNHIAREEEEIVGKAGGALTEADWKTVRDAVPSRPDPVFGTTPDERFRELRRQIALES